MREHIVHRVTQPRDDFPHVVLTDNEWRRQQNMVSPAAVHGSPRRITNQTALKRRFLDLNVDPEFGIERFLRISVGNKFYGTKQAAPANFPDLRMIAEAIVERLIQNLALALHVGQQVALLDGVLNRQCGRAGGRMPHIGVARAGSSPYRR